MSTGAVKMPVALSFINMKGGVGKTTIASQLARAAAADGLRVLAVDLDPQSNLSHAIMGPEDYRDHIENNRPTVTQILEEYIPSGRDAGVTSRIDPQDVILSGEGRLWENLLDLIPSRLELSRILRDPSGKERLLARFLALVSDRHDLIVIDCAPTESILTDVAYFASRYVIVPVKPEFMATIGLPLLARSVEQFCRQNADHHLDIAGLVLNDQSEYIDNREKKTALLEVREVANEYGWHLFGYRIPYSRSYPQAARKATRLARTPYARWDRVAGFDGLKNEILHAVGIWKDAK